MPDDIATASPGIADLGDGVFQIDTKMADYPGSPPATSSGRAALRPSLFVA